MSLYMSHSTANSTQYSNFWILVFNSASVVQRVKLPATGRTVLWSNSGEGVIYFSVQTSTGTAPTASTIGKGALTWGIKRPSFGTDFSSPYVRTNI